MVKNVGNPAVSQLPSEFYNQPSGLLHEQGRRPRLSDGSRGAPEQNKWPGLETVVRRQSNHLKTRHLQRRNVKILQNI